jgi:hypothetical protein
MRDVAVAGGAVEGDDRVRQVADLDETARLARDVF